MGLNGLMGLNLQLKLLLQDWQDFKNYYNFLLSLEQKLPNSHASVFNLNILLQVGCFNCLLIFILIP